MNSQGVGKYVAVGFVAVLAVVIGSLLLGSAISGEEGDTFGRVFLSTLGAALTIFGVGAGVASTATYLTGPH